MTILIQQHGNIKHLPVNNAATMYLDYVNNFLTLERFAEYYGLSYTSAQRVYAVGKEVHEQRVANLKTPAN